ncbi:hypothetical protein F5876DRAFT_69646 [Lentinula aff. lateritia]|uniref:Uncharacterized protein n=1 Tax=Lentinula aff. lateritia TaxID=2804960 RepID=A0ACC1TLX1_9AGAR|nr:hypothetical protein F5876DRAFT_69646 [Lentinula aff. lateritia]
MFRHVSNANPKTYHAYQIRKFRAAYLAKKQRLMGNALEVWKKNGLYDLLLEKYIKSKSLECLEHDLVAQTPVRNRSVKMVDHISEFSASKSISERSQVSSQKVTPPHRELPPPPSRLTDSQSPEKRAHIKTAKQSKKIGSPKKLTQQYSDDDSEEIIPESEDENHSEEEEDLYIASPPKKVSESIAETKTQRSQVKGTSTLTNTTMMPTGVGTHAERASHPIQSLSQERTWDVEKFVELHLIKRKVLSLMHSASGPMQAKLHDISYDLEDAAASHLPQANDSVKMAQGDDVNTARKQHGAKKRLDKSDDEENEVASRKKQKMREENQDQDDGSSSVAGSAIFLKRVAPKKRIHLPQ